MLLYSHHSIRDSGEVLLYILPAVVVTAAQLVQYQKWISSTTSCDTLTDEYFMSMALERVMVKWLSGSMYRDRKNELKWIQPNSR
jgi:hypothetical protein